MRLYILTILSVIILNLQLFAAVPFEFTVFGDTQFENPDIFAEMIEKVNQEDSVIALHVGDMIHGYHYSEKKALKEWKRFFKEIQPLKAEFCPTPGNHDMTTKALEKVYREVWGKKNGYYSFAHENAAFIVLNQFEDQKFYKMSDIQFSWLKDQLELYKEKDHIFVTMHSPLYMRVWETWGVFHELFRKYPVRAVFTGHSHIYDYRALDGIDYFCLNTAGRMIYKNHLAGFSHHFLQVAIHNERIDYRVVERNHEYSITDVPPAQFEKMKPYFQDSPIIQLSDKQWQKKNITLEALVENKSPDARIFYLTWKTSNRKCHFAPWGKTVVLGPYESQKVAFKMKADQPLCEFEQLPILFVESPFRNDAGKETSLSYFFRLFHPQSITARRLKVPLNDYEWPDAEAWKSTGGIDQLYLDYDKTPAKEANQIQFLYDSENIYVRAVLSEKNDYERLALAYGDVPLVFGDDDIELFFDTNRDLSTYFRIMSNSKGTKLCSGPMGLFSFDFDVRTTSSKGAWSAEFRIAFDELDIDPPQKGDVWGLNIRRNYHAQDPSVRDWSKMRYFPYQPTLFGLMHFK